MVTCITETDRLTNIKCSDELANTTTVTDVTLFTLLVRTGLLTFDGLRSLLTDFTAITFGCITETERFTNI